LRFAFVELDVELLHEGLEPLGLVFKQVVHLLDFVLGFVVVCHKLVRLLDYLLVVFLEFVQHVFQTLDFQKHAVFRGAQLE